MAKALEFHPSRPPRREMFRLAFLALLFVMVAPNVLAHRDPWPLAGLTGLALLIAGGSWIMLRLRYRGSPTLRVDKAGLVYRRSGHEQSLAWSEITAILTYHYRKEIHFLASGPPLVIHRDMVAEDGRRFDMLVDHYWKAPKKRRDAGG